jgi:hypothetical protein
VKVVLEVKVVLVADVLPVPDDLVVLMLQVEIRKAIAHADLQLNRIRLRIPGIQPGYCSEARRRRNAGLFLCTSHELKTFE